MSDSTLTTSEELNLALRDPDVRLMLRAKEGDQEAFSQLVVGYQDRLVNVLRHLLQDQELAEDLAQEVFLRVYRARNGYTPTAKFATWLFKIANNLASNSRRSAGRRKESAFGGSSKRSDDQQLVEKSALMPARQLDRRELRDVVRDALQGLNDRQRMAVLLHKFEGMCYADIAATMEISTSAVKSLLSRARESLREKLEPYVQEGRSLSPDGEGNDA